MLKEEGEECLSKLGHDVDGFHNAGLALLEFLVPRRPGQRASPAQTYALLSGPPKCGKTSLLLQLAYNLAVDALARVIFICKPQNFEDDYIYLSLEMDISCAVSERVHIKYISDDQELCKYFAAFHLHLELPTAVIVDDFVAYFGECVGHEEEGMQVQATEELPLVKTLCLCHNAINYANEKAVSGLQCRLVISDTHPDDGPRLLYIFQRWLSQAFVITALDDLSTFSLEVQNLKTGEKGNAVGRYVLEDQVLHFDGLEACSQPAVKLEEPDS